MNNNSFGQIQYLLTQISSYVEKINEIIFQINNIINSQNQMNEMMQMNMMNNMMNFPNNFNLDFNPLLNNKPPELNNKLIKIVFDYRGNLVTISAKEYLPITEAINIFLRRINKLEFINNYKGKMRFLFNALDLDMSKKVGELNQSNDFKIVVVVSKEVCNNLKDEL